MFVNDADIWLDGSTSDTMFVNDADIRLVVNDADIWLDGSTSDTCLLIMLTQG